MADADARLAVLRQLFTDLFSRKVREFGSPPLGAMGFCDDASGVQWNAYLRLKEPVACVGVNLEGMAYDEWPVARFIERELEQPRLFEVLSRLNNPEDIELLWRRDAWQASARVHIVERYLGATPLKLDCLTLRDWREALTAAYECLDPHRGHRGRARQQVTLSASQQTVEREVSPHLQFRCRFTKALLDDPEAARRALLEAKERLQPLYDFVASRTAG